MHVTEHHVLDVLNGVPPETVAAVIPTTTTDLNDAVSAYRTAGRYALDVRDRRWFQAHVQFPDWNTAERTAADRLLPRLRTAQHEGVITAWWYVRKHPYWRLRCSAGPDGTRGQAAATLTGLLDGLLCDGAVLRWQESIYEPESLTFGGTYGIDLAHRLFHADSDAFLNHLAHTESTEHPDVGRRERSLLLCGTMMRAARQDAAEQADIWDRVARMRPLPTEPTTGQLRRLRPAIRQLLSADTTPTSTLFKPDGSMTHADGWFAAFADAGRQLADVARDGALERGLRGTLASHVIFHWNRHGLATRAQAITARAARNALLDPTDDVPHGVTDAPDPR